MAKKKNEIYSSEVGPLARMILTYRDVSVSKAWDLAAEQVRAEEENLEATRAAKKEPKK